MGGVKAICIEGVCVSLPEDWSQWDPKERDELLQLLNAANRPEEGTKQPDEKLSIARYEPLTPSPVEHNIEDTSGIAPLGIVDLNQSSPDYEKILTYFHYSAFSPGPPAPFLPAPLFHLYFLPSKDPRNGSVDRTKQIEKELLKSLATLREFGALAEENAETVIVHSDQSERDVAGHTPIKKIGLEVAVISYEYSNTKLITHELAHTFIAKYDPDCKEEWLEEGFAEFMENFDPNKSVWDRMTLPLESGYPIFMPFTMVNSKNSVDDALSHAFWLFLEDTRGREKIRSFCILLQWVKDVHIALLQVMGADSLGELETEFHDWLSLKVRQVRGQEPFALTANFRPHLSFSGQLAAQMALGGIFFIEQTPTEKYGLNIEVGVWRDLSENEMIDISASAHLQFNTEDPSFSLYCGLGGGAFLLSKVTNPSKLLMDNTPYFFLEGGTHIHLVNTLFLQAGLQVMLPTSDIADTAIGPDIGLSYGF